MKRTTSSVMLHLNATPNTSCDRCVPSPLVHLTYIFWCTREKSHPKPYHSCLQPLTSNSNISSHRSKMSNDQTLQGYLDANERWVAEKSQEDPDFSEITTMSQSPKILWFGCSDSRVPEHRVVGCKHGHVFVHRNIAK